MARKARTVSKKLILVVDDQELNVKLLRIILELRGYAVAAASDARQARESVRAARPDLVLMDVQLPETDGLQLTREFKTDPGLGLIPIIAVTSHAMMGDDERALAAGCDAYLSKPIDRAALIALIERFLPSFHVPR